MSAVDVRGRRFDGRGRSATLAFGAALALLLVAGEGSAQIVPIGPLKLQPQFNFSNPGARSLGLAGAFLSRADDATAAYVNPAGLVHLRYPEVMVEARDWQTDVTLRDQAGNEAVLDSSQSGLSFLSVTYPMKRVTLGLYRHELVNYGVSGGVLDLAAADLDLDISGIGLSAGFLVTAGFRVGATVVAYDSDLEGSATTVDGETSRASGSGGEIGYTLGYQIDFGDDVTFGFVLREGPSFGVRIESEESVEKQTFTVPDLIGAGLSWEATHRLVASLDYYYIQYSATVSDERRGDGRFVVPDGKELRLGLEYTLWEQTTSPAFRLGVWRDPDHQVRFKPDDDSTEAIETALEFPKGDAETHLSVGFGVVFKRVQLDVAADFSDSVDTYSLSAIFFF